MASFFVKRALNTNQFFLCRPFLPIGVQCCAYGEIANGPIRILDDKVSKGELMSDEHQRNVVEALEEVYHKVEIYEPAKPGIFTKWISKGKKKKKAPKGLYLYGAVGGGKTMLMDLFYNSCQVSQFVSRIKSHLKSQKKKAKEKFKNQKKNETK